MAISVDLLLKYFELMKSLLPEYVAAAPIPGEVTNDNVIDFSTTSADKDIDRLSQSQDTILATSGGGITSIDDTITTFGTQDDFTVLLAVDSERNIITDINEDIVFLLKPFKKNNITIEIIIPKIIIKDS